MKAFKMAAWAVLALLLGVAAVSAKEYYCPGTCQPNLGCQCASSKAPGSIANGDIPQFIVLTNDDAITVVSQPIILNITERHTNKNGCKMPATWFVSVDYTDPNLVKQVFVRGHEIATHTVDHVANPNVTQILGARDWLNKTAGIPKEKIGGFRAPFLIFNPEQRNILQKNGFWFDSSISEQYPSKTSPSAAERLWPYTMDYGIPQDCSISTGTCNLDESHPGLWEFPMWNIQDSTGVTVASMDPPGNAFELYKQQFDERYNGNRAPLGIFIHAAWMIANTTRADMVNQFLEYATSKDNVFLVTASQVLDWMKNPVPASQYSPSCPSQTELVGLLPQGTTLCVVPSGGCSYGTYDSSTCNCKCQNEEINAAGYCRDAAGRCTVQKEYNFEVKQYFCPEPVAAAPAPTPTAGTTTMPGGTTTQALSVEMDVIGTNPSDFQVTKAVPFCAQLLRLTEDPAAKCSVVSVVSVTGRRLLQDKLHVIARLETMNADATKAALQLDTFYTLLSPAGVIVVPGSVKVTLGAPVVPLLAADSISTDVDGSSSGDSSFITPTDGSSDDGGSLNTAAIVGAVLGTLAGVVLLCGSVWYWRCRKAAKAAKATVSAHTVSMSPAFHTGGVTCMVSTNRSPIKKQLTESAISESPLRDSMARTTSGQQ